MLVDTIAASVTVDHDLPGQVFQAASVRQDFVAGDRNVRLFRNPQGDEYEPRLTYWPDTRLLRIEFSVQKFGAAGCDGWLSVQGLGPLPPFASWRVQRIDYTTEIEVGALLPQYLALLGRLGVASWSRQPHATGIVWKSQSRWVKFYAREQVLRYEVSNYRDAVRYMAAHWFGCDRTVDEMVRDGRALYVLAHYYEKLGLAHSTYDSREYELRLLREAFGARCLPGAAHALACIQAHGTQSYKTLSLMSKSSYYRWLAALRAHGFLASAERSVLPALALPVEAAFEACSEQNLKSPLTGPATHPLEMRPKNSWEKLAELLQVSVKAPENSYLLERFNEFRSDLDRKTRGMPFGGPKFAVRAARQGAAARAGA